MKIKLLFLILTVILEGTLSFAQQSVVDSLYHVLKNATADTTKVTVLNALAWELKFNNPDTAIVLSNSALQMAEKQNWQKGIASSCHSLGSFYWGKGNYSKSLDYNLKALTTWEELEKRAADEKEKYKVLERKSSTVGNIGGIYYSQGNYPKALEYFFKALKIDEELMNESGIARHLGNIGIVYMEQGDYPKALEYYFKAWKLVPSESNRTIENKVVASAILGNIGIVYYNQRNYPKALEYYFMALEIDEAVGNKRDIAADLGNIAVVYDDQSDYTKALEYYLKALEIKEELGDKNGMAIKLGNIGSSYIKKASLPGISFGSTGEYFKKAEDYLQRALVLSDSIGAVSLQKDHHNYFSELYSKTNRHQLALEHYKKYIIARDSIFNEENTEKIVRSEMNFEFEKKEQEARLEQEKKDAVAIEEKQKQKIITASVSIGLLVVLLFSGLLFNRFRTTQRQKEVIEEQKLIVEEKNKDITDSINYAQRIQKALLASDNLLSNNLGEHFVFLKPKDIVSGDFYWAVEKDNRFYLAVCDSTGHGVPGAFMSLLNISFLNEAVNEKGMTRPNEIFDHVRQRLIENISSEGAKDGMDAILICMDRNNNTLSYAAAHNAPILLNDGIPTKLTADKMPVGLSEKKDSFTLHTVEVKQGSMLYLCSDGFADQFGGPKGKKFKYKKLEELLVSIHEKPIDEQKDILDKTLEDWIGNLEQVDDVCIIGARV